MSTALSQLIDRDVLVNEVQGVIDDLPIDLPEIDALLNGIDNDFDWQAIGEFLAIAAGLTVGVALGKLVYPYVIAEIDKDPVAKKCMDRINTYLELRAIGQISDTAMQRGIGRAKRLCNMANRHLDYRAQMQVVRVAQRIKDFVSSIMDWV